MTGGVALVGAGPGDPGLMTVRGLAILRKAQVVVYDRLIDPRLLDEAPPRALRVFVGKASGAHTLPQAEINALLVAGALRSSLDDPLPALRGEGAANVPRRR